MTLQIKICGVTTPEIARHAVNEGADMIGLVFFERSPRYIDAATAARIADEVRGEADIVGLFVNPDMTRLADTIAEVPLTHLQLHGSEKPERVENISSSFGLSVIKAVGVSAADDISSAEGEYGDIADMLLFDAKPPPKAMRPGGHGVTFDLSILADVKGTAPWMLSGGLRPDNVADAIREVRTLPGFSGIDVSSGVEKEIGEKDNALVSAFISGARGADA